MPRPARAFTAESFALEGRLLLTAGPASTPTSPPIVQFGTAKPTRFVGPTPPEVVTQQAGEATVTLSRSDTTGSLRVEVATESSSLGVGVNVGAVDQTVTFADGQGQATLTVPILAGAPNPGEVNVFLTLKPIDPATIPSQFLDLEVVASDPTLPPKVVSVENLSHEILLSFNKPMNPVGASNVKNYVVKSTTDKDTGFLGLSHSVSVNSVPLKSAQYDPTTQSVTLIPKHPIRNIDLAASLIPGQRARTWVRPGQQPNVAQGLTDLQGNPINADTTPGKVEIGLSIPSYFGGGSL